MGRSYVVKGVNPPPGWEPKAGDVVYIEGRRTKLGKPNGDMFPLRPPVDGTTDMGIGNIKAIARIPKPVKMPFDVACGRYVNRFTMEHVPNWALHPHEGKYYAPQFRSDREWYEASEFPPHPLCFETDCYSRNQTWPLGQWLDKPYSK